MQKFNFHTHTRRCNHADVVPDEEYVKGHIRCGFDRMAFTDHCPWKWMESIDNPMFRQRMWYSEKKGYLESIRDLRRKYAKQIKIYSGFEVEYLPSEVEAIREMRSESDVLVLGQHVFMRDGKPVEVHTPDPNRPDSDFLSYASLVIEGVESGMFDILAHPDLFIAMSSSFGEIQERTSDLILKCAEKTGIPIEINLRQISKPIAGESGPTGKDFGYPCPEFWRMATAYNVNVIYGIDAHRLYQFDLHDKIIEAANRHIGYDTVSKLHFIDRLAFED